MTEEELEKEAKTESFMLTVNTIGIDQRDVELAYILGRKKSTKQIETQEKRIAELEAQIEKMKCCENCAWWYRLPNGERDCAEVCGNFENWSLRRKK